MDRTRARRDFGRSFRTLLGGHRSRMGLATGLATLLAVAGMIWGSIPAHAFGGNNSTQTVPLHRQGCAATAEGITAGTAGLSLDDQGGGNTNPNGLEIHVAVTAGASRTTYTVSVVGSACQVLVTGGTLTTDDSGRGDLDFHVLGSVVPPGTSVRVQLLAPADVITSDLTNAP